MERPSKKMELIATHIGRMKVGYEKHNFVFMFTRQGTSFWHCENFEKTKCTAAVLTRDNKTYPYITQHECEAVLKK